MKNIFSDLASRKILKQFIKKENQASNFFRKCPEVKNEMSMISGTSVNVVDVLLEMFLCNNSTDMWFR